MTAAPALARFPRSATPARRELGLARSAPDAGANGLRDVIVQADGGLKTGLDVIKAALLGAEFRLRHRADDRAGLQVPAHLPPQQLRHRHRHPGRPPARRAFHRPARTVEISSDWPRSARLPGATRRALAGPNWSAAPTCCSKWMRSPPPAKDRPVAAAVHRRLASRAAAIAARRDSPLDDGLAAELDADPTWVLTPCAGRRLRLPIRNTDRSIGARLSGEIARLHGNHGMHDAPIDLHFTGTAGQSFGGFLAGGLQLTLEGEGQRLRRQGHGRRAHRDPSAARRAASSPATRRSSATPACTAPPAASCSPRATPANASRCAIPARWRWWKAWATTAANT